MGDSDLRARQFPRWSVGSSMQILAAVWSRSVWLCRGVGSSAAQHLSRRPGGFEGNRQAVARPNIRPARPGSTGRIVAGERSFGFALAGVRVAVGERRGGSP
jgi:hypothetical protein